MRWFRLLLVLGSLVAGALPAAADPRVPTESDARNRVAAHGRTLDQLSNPDYLARQAAALDSCVEAEKDVCFYTDPYRASWASSGRGEQLPVSWDNRYDVRISGHLWAPAKAGREPLPTVVVIGGNLTNEQQYWAFAQGLAEAGYLVLSFDPQCHGASGCKPRPEYCDPDGAWRQPQEMGVVEQGECAGEQPKDDPAATVAFAQYGGGCLTTGECDDATLRATYDRMTAPHVLGALDAVDFLLSPSNAWRARVDPDRIGIAGHSFGSHGALLAGNGDPLHRFATAVSWDGGGALPASVPPRIPTMFQRADHDEYTARTRTPDPEQATSLINARQFSAAGVPTAHVALGGGSTHQEWSYTPFFGAALAGQFVASRDGERVALHYTLAWFDRFLRGPARDARDRLVTRAFDASADRSSTGQGSYDVATRSNVPYTIAGENTAEHLSELHPSWVDAPGARCHDLRQGCAQVPGRGRLR